MDYPFTLIEMRLDKEGKGEGHIAMATKISVTGTAARMKMSAYYEFDFLGAAPTANEVESNSFNIRQRQLWAQVNLDGGFSFTGGQTWSLITLNRAGIAPRAEWIPQTIDAQYAVGFNWTRQWSARVAQKFGGGGLWLQHQPEPTSPSSQIVVSSTPGANGVSTDVAPDLVGKIAFEPGRGHHEIKGLLRP